MSAKVCLSAALLVAAIAAKPEVDAASDGFNLFHLPITGEALVNDLEHINRLNSQSMTWKAGPNSFFEGKTFNDARALLGTVAPDRHQIHPTLDDSVYEAIKTTDVPAAFDSRTQWPGLVHPIRNQQHCGSCWAFSAAEVLSDRFAIATKKESPVLSPEDLVSCDTTDMGCRGGQLPAAWNYLQNTGIVADTCFPYTAGNGTAPSCATKCADAEPFTRSKAASAYSIQGVENMQKEIMTNGPIQVAFKVYKSFMSYTSGVYSKRWYELIPEGGHAVKIVGWGTESGTDYWLVANSWDTTWGLDGFFKFKRGTNEGGMETMGPPYAGLPATSKDNVPHLPLTGEGLVNDLEHIKRLNSEAGMTWKAGLNTYFDGKTFDDARMLLGTSAPESDQIHATRNDSVYAAIKTTDLPADFDSRTQWPGLVHPIRNQQHCGSCWAFSASEVLSDRFAIATKKASPVLSPEDMVSCDTTDMGCGGGQLPAAWNYLKETGIVTDTCFPYAAGDGTAPSCATKCADSQPFTRSKASSAYSIQGVENMQKEIMTNGPIQVAFKVYKSFMSYKSGVYSKHFWELVPEGGHAVKIVGWGTESGTDYWLVANSWDTTWGLDGYFKFKRGTNEGGMETMGPPYAGLPATSMDSTVVV